VNGGSLIRQTAEFDPLGVGGLVYWYGLWGVHQFVSAGMLRSITRVAEGGAGGGVSAGGGVPAGGGVRAGDVPADGGVPAE